MKKRLAALLLAALISVSLLPTPAFAAGTAHFTDVKAGHWAYPYVERAYSDGAIVGTGGDPASGTGVFSPDTNMTYGQFLTMLVSAFYPGEADRNRQDGDPWYAPATRTALNHELTYISSERLMALNSTRVNRYNAAWILVKLLEDKGAALPTEQERAQAAGRIGDWQTVVADQYWEYCVSSAVASGIISGVDGRGTFDGDGYITRGAAAVIYTKLADKLNRPDQSSGQDSQGAALRQQYQLVYEDGWNLITQPGYRENLERAFYETYPRVVARWGDSMTQTVIPIGVKETLVHQAIDRPSFMWTAYRNYDQTTKLWERYIEISAKNQETRPSWALTHELTHVVQNYPAGFQSSWWVESMASYSHLRYCCWADPYFFEMEDYFQPEDQRDWNFEAYGGRWFFAYMDARYPTTPAGRGLIDSIHYAIKAGEITSDDISDPNLNAVVKRVTGLSTIDQVRRQFVRELDAGTWTFNGFAGYADNYITEHIPGVPDPRYFTPEEVNLCTGADTYSASGEASAKLEADNLVDGDRSTKWQASERDVDNKSTLSWDARHSLCVSLEKSVTIDTYTLYHEGNGQSTVSWRLSYYDSQRKEWRELDQVTGNTQDVTTRKVTPVKTKNLWLEILEPSGTGDGTVRLYELELYNKG